MANTQSISALKGRTFLLKVNVAGTSPPTYTTVGGLRTTDLSINSNPVDITNKGSNGWRELLVGAGVEQLTVSGSGPWADGDTALQKVLTCSLPPQSLIEAELIDTVTGDTFAGYWAVSTFKRSAPYNAEQTYDVTLESSGTITYTAGT